MGAASLWEGQMGMKYLKEGCCHGVIDAGSYVWGVWVSPRKQN